MEDTQWFRLTGTTEILKVLTHHVDGQSIVYWDSIEQAFPGARQVKNGNVAIPRCIKAFPGVVLDVVLSSAIERPDVDSLVEIPNVETPGVIPTIALAPALTVGLTHTSADLPTDLPANLPTSEDKFVESVPATSALTETPINDVGAHTSLTGSTTLPSTSISKIKATSRTAPSFKQIVHFALKKGNESDSQVQLQEISANMAHMIKLQNASDAKQEEIMQLQNQALEQQEDMKRLQNQALEQQEEMKRLHKRALEGQEKLDRLQNEMKQLQIQNQEELRQMHTEAMGQLAVLQSRVQAILTQTFELHEYPIPRLFIVIPQDPSRWDAVNPFSNKFRLYFLCECGEHTKSAHSKTKIPHHIHLAKHEGYEITRPSEFFQQYGPYVLTILKMLKLGITAAGVVMPALSQLISLNVIGQSIDSLKQPQKSIMPSVDRVIECIDKLAEDEGKAVEDISVSKGRSVEEAAEKMDTMEALEGADLRKLELLQSRDMSNGYASTTYRENYQETQAEAFRRALDSVGGSFDENTGLVMAKLRTRVLAEQFYAGLRKARCALELDIDLDFECTKSDLEELEHVLRTSSISILRLNHQRFRTSATSKLLSKSA
ncbi:hypothetical protein BGZ98_001813 [Dissophora globulifera]|nr:hypothetical protein BGZ98_001813 [Dissophora globulifera]